MSIQKFLLVPSSCTEIFTVGFTKTTYTVIESDGQVEVCVSVSSPEEDIGDEMVLVEIINNDDSGSIPIDVAAASKLT